MKIGVTGHRPGRIAGREDWIRDTVRRELTASAENGPVTALSGMAPGVDQIFAEVAVELGIPYIAYVPFPDFMARWDVVHRESYENLLTKAETQVIVSNTYFGGVYLARDRALVNNADSMMAFWDGVDKGGTAYTISYARKKLVPITVFDV